MDTTYTCRDCQQQPAVVFNPDGAYRCRPCQRAHVALVRQLRADMAKRTACRWTVGPRGAWCSAHRHGTGDQAQRTV